jgi:hypothetical protein
MRQSEQQVMIRVGSRELAGRHDLLTSTAPTVGPQQPTRSAAPITSPPMQQYLPGRMVADRYHVSLMSVHRWRTRKRNPLPPPLVISGRNYWREDVLDHWDAVNAAESAAKSAT